MTKNTVQRLGLAAVIGGGGGAMGVDVVNTLSRPTRIRKGALHRPGRPLRVGHHDIGGIRGHTNTADFSQNARATDQRGLALLQYKHRRPFPLHHAVAPHRERTAGVGRHDAEAFPRFQPAKGQHRLGPARQRNICDTRAQHLNGKANGMV